MKKLNYANREQENSRLQSWDESEPISLNSRCV